MHPAPRHVAEEQVSLGVGPWSLDQTEPPGEHLDHGRTVATLEPPRA